MTALTPDDLREIQTAFLMAGKVVTDKLAKLGDDMVNVETLNLGDDVPATEPEPAGRLVTLSFTELDEDVINPDRGWAKSFDIFRTDDKAERVRAEGYTLAWAMVDLSEWIDTDLPAEFLSRLDAAIDHVYRAGLKLILRFRYDSDGTGADAKPERMLMHVAQLSEVLTRNAHAIHVLQAGLIGKWGEMHGSTHPENETPEHRLALTEALLDAFPGVVALRRPGWVRDMLTDAAISDDDRLAVYDDCILCSDDDGGSWDNDDGGEWFWRDYIGQLGTSYGGEVSVMGELTELQGGANAIDVFETSGLTYWHVAWNTAVHDGWKKTPDPLEPGWITHYEIIKRRTGYRLELDTFTFPEPLTSADNVLRIKLRNTGFAAPMMDEPLRLALLDEQGGVAYEATLMGMRDLVPNDPDDNTDAHFISHQLSSAPLKAGVYRAVSKAGTGEHAVRFASLNDDGFPVWNAISRANELGFITVG